jgi:hypothetical protein
MVLMMLTGWLERRERSALASLIEGNVSMHVHGGPIAQPVVNHP